MDRIISGAAARRVDKRVPATPCAHCGGTGIRTACMDPYAAGILFCSQCDQHLRRQSLSRQRNTVFLTQFAVGSAIAAATIGLFVL